MLKQIVSTRTRGGTVDTLFTRPFGDTRKICLLYGTHSLSLSIYHKKVILENNKYPYFDGRLRLAKTFLGKRSICWRLLRTIDFNIYDAVCDFGEEFYA